jgi:hypothetical protein
MISALVADGAALAVALIATLGTIITAAFTAAANRRQERVRLTVQLALADQQSRIQALKGNLLGPTQRALPLDIMA